MFNYFYSVELNIAGGPAAKKTYGTILDFLATPLQTVEATSKEYYSENECMSAISLDIDRIKNLIQQNIPHLTDDDIMVEAYTNPFIEIAGAPPQDRPTTQKEIEDEKAFWTTNKLATFAIYDTPESDDFIARFTIFVYEDELRIEKFDASARYSIANAPTTVN